MVDKLNEIRFEKKTILICRDKAIEAADECCQLTREKRIENFENILKEILHKAESKTECSCRLIRCFNVLFSLEKKRPSKKSLPPTIEDKSSKRQKTKSTVDLSFRRRILLKKFPLVFSLLQRQQRYYTSVYQS